MFHFHIGRSASSFLKKYWKRCIASALLCMVLLSTTVTAARAASWEGWTEENQEQAWAVFSLSQWNKTASDIIFSSDGSISKSDVPDSFRNAVIPADDPDDPGKTYEEVVVSVLEDPIFQTSSALAFPASDYRELLLIIAYQLNEKGESILSGNGFETEKVDVCFYGTYIAPKLNISSVRESFRYLMNRYRLSEQAYLHANSSADGSDLFPNIYEVNSSLQSVIQGVVYGYISGGQYYGYSKSSSNYSEDNAKQYYGTNQSKLPSSITEDFSSFAEDVTSKYIAIRSLGETVVEGW